MQIFRFRLGGWPITRRLHVGLRLLWQRLKRNVRRVSTQLARRKALLWHQLYVARHRYLVLKGQHGQTAIVAIILVLIAVSAYWIPTIQNVLGPYFASEERIDLLQSLFLTVGGALIGAAAIVSSLVLFAMQVNIERMPHGLFSRLSADRRLLSAFAATFLLAVGVAAVSLVPNQEWIGLATFGAFWGTGLVLALFLYGYRRALILVNPTRQLELVVRRTRQELRVWTRRANRAAPLLSNGDESRSVQGKSPESRHDLTRTAYFQANPHWTEGALQGVRYAVSFARRYAEQGDHEVSATSMNAIITINEEYVKAKGKTFFAYQLICDNPLTSDGFINNTLEHLRQTARIGVARGDEQQIEQTLTAMAMLVRVYAAIDYATPYASKTHAHLAAGYLSNQVEQIVPHNMPDVLMEGVRLMGQCADILLATEGAQGITTLTQKIGVISCAGVARESYRPVTSTGVEQLARLSFNLLRTRSHETRFAAEEIRGSMKLIAKLLMTLPDDPMTNIHGTYLAPYYSATSGFSVRLSELVNTVADAPADNNDAQQVVHNIEKWADGMYQTEKELFLDAIGKRSQFTFDMVHWIKTVTKILLAVSNAAACNEHTQAELRRHARWLIAVLSFVPDDEETVKFVEFFKMTETLFESAVDARRHGCIEIAEDIGKMLLSWMFKAGRHHTGWAILKRSVYGLATLALLNEDRAAVGRLKKEISDQVTAGGLPDKDVRDRAAREIRGRAATLYRPGHWSSVIEQGLAQGDSQKLEPLLRDIADVISPDTIGEEVTFRFL